MDARQEIDEMVGEPRAEESPEASRVSDKPLLLATNEVTKLLAMTNDSLGEICNDIEGATSREACREAFRRFNEIVRMFLVSAPDPCDNDQICEAILSLEPSEHLGAMLQSHLPLQDAIKDYKTSILKALAVSLSRSVAAKVVSEEQDDDLFDQFLPEHSTMAAGPLSSDAGQSFAGIVHPASPVSRKRCSSEIADNPSPQVILKKKRSSIPALASLCELSGGSDLGGAAKKRTLLTREKLRAGIRDPKGLLDLTGPSTSAIDRTLQLELLKSAGYDFSNKCKSFSDRLHAATLRLELGLGGHSMADTLLFGASVLNSPGFLSKKNILDVENNVVNASTTWKHQDAYAKMVIAGCLEQAKKIIEKFDEVLYGPAPESLVEDTHSAIADLLVSEEAEAFLSRGRGNANDDTSRENFIKKIIEAVAPILPITIRNKSLDGCYLRSALHLVGVAELVFSQYVTDIRSQANPAGVVGMCNAMHAKLKKSTLLSSGLSPSDEFLREMRSQYQTCLGLGCSFPNDKAGRSNRSSSWKGRSRTRSGNVDGSSGRDSARGNPQQYFPYRGNAARDLPSGRGQTGPFPARAPCFDFQAGTCRRGRACRFAHSVQ